MAAPSSTIMGSVQILIHEKEVLKAVLEFLESRKFHITQLSLERETGLINGEYPEDVLFLRQLILDGQWDSALEFVEPLKDLPEFDISSFRHAVIKYKYYELLCIKQEPGPMHDNDFAVEEIVECLKELEGVCSSGEEFRRLCALLTLPKLSDHEELKSWNPSNARMECFYKVLPLVAELLGGLGPGTAKASKKEVHACNDRLLQLVAKGLLYEGCVDYCQSQALQGKSAPLPDNKFLGVLPPLPKPRLSSTDLSLVSWLQVLGNEQFTVPFEQKTLEFKLDVLKKPKLEAQWTDQILATPFKPGGQFPHSLVPHAKLKCAQKQIMSQSMVLPCMFSSLAVDSSSGPANRRSNRNLSNQAMSQSTTASIGSFSINPKSDQVVDDQSGDVMKQSQLITHMLEQNSELSNRPARLFPPNQTQLPCSPSTSPPAQSSSSGISLNSAPGSTGSMASGSQSMYMGAGLSTGSSQSRRELDAICRRNQAQAPGSIIRQSCLPSVPELATPTNIPNNSFAAAIGGRIEPMVDDPMTHSRLFQQFSNRQTHRPSFSELQQQYTPVMHNYNMNAGQGYPPFEEYQQQQAMLQQRNNMMTTTNIPYLPPQMPIDQQPLPTMRPNPAVQQQQYPAAPPQHVPSEYSNQRPVSMVMDLNNQLPVLQAQHQRPRSYVDLASYPTNSQPARPDSIVEQYAPAQRQSADSTDEPISTAASSLPVNFVPLCRYEDSQAIRAVSFHPSGKYFVIGTNSKQMLVCKYPDLRKIDQHRANQSLLPPSPEVLLSRPKQHRGSVYCCGFNTSGELLATGSNDKTLRLMAFNADGCRIGAEMELVMHDGTVRELIFMEDSGSHHSSIVVSGGAGNCHICLTDCTTGRTYKSFVGHTAPILGLYSWGPGTCFSSCSQDKTIRFWDLRASNAVNVIMPNARTSNSPVTSVCIDPSGKLLVSGHEDASVMLYDVIGGRTVQVFRPHGDEVRTVRCSNAAYYLLSGSYDKRVVITDMRGDLTSPLMYLPVAEHADKVIQCRWHPQDFTFLSTSADRSAVLWSLPSQSSS